MSVRRYTKTAMTLHWLIALLIITAFSLGWVMSDMPGLSMAKLRYFSWHKWLGVTVFLLALIRIVWRAGHPAPLAPTPLPLWQVRAAQSVHLALYALIVLIPLSGYFYSLAAGVPVVYLGLIPLPVLIEKNAALADLLKQVHGILNYTLAAMVAVHVLAALKHQFVDQDGTLLRMLPRFGRDV